MAVKYPKEYVSRFYSSSLHKEKNSRYSLRNSSQNSLPAKSLRLLSSPVYVNKRPSGKNIKHFNMPERKSEYNLRNLSFNVSYNEQTERKSEYNLRNLSFNVSYNERPKRIAKSLESTSNIKAEHPIKKKLKKIVYTRGKRKENFARNSCLSTSNNSRRKRSASCIEYTPNTKTEHPMRKKLRELAFVSKSKDKSLTNQNMPVNLDVNYSPLTCNQINVLNSISSKPLSSENAPKALKKAPPPSRISTRSTSKTFETSEKCEQKLKNSKATDSPVLKCVIISECSARKKQMKDLKSICEDELVLKAKTIKVKSSTETPVIKQNFSRSFRNGNNSRNCAGKVELGQLSVTSNSKRVPDKNIAEVKDLLKTRYSDTSTPVTTRLKKRTSSLKIQTNEAVTLPKRGQREDSLSFDSVLKSSKKCVGVMEGKKNIMKTRSSKAAGKAIVEDKKQKKFQRKTRCETTVLEKHSECPIDKRITRSATFNCQDNLFTANSFLKKSKRHTFPNSDKCSKSKNPLRVYSVHNFNDVPLDILTNPGASFHESQSHTSKVSIHPSLKKVAPQTLQENNDVLIKTPVPKTSLKKKKTSKLPEKISGSKKIPAKGTLRRKRWIMTTLKQKNEGHEDDIFENKKFEFPKPFFGSMISDEESDSTDVSIATPVCGFLLTPNISRKSPQYKPCISSNDLTAARKDAEEYLYRRNKTWKQKNFPEKRPVTLKSNQALEKGTEYSDALANVLKAQTDIEKLLQDESDEDDYFSDVS